MSRSSKNDGNGNLADVVPTALAAGLAGAIALTAVHETTRRLTPRAPRMDVLGERAITKMVRGAGGTPPRGKALHRWALAGDIAANALFYALVGSGQRQAWLRGTGLGLLAGAGAVALPPVLGLGRAPRGQERPTQAMTVGYYLLGGLVAAGAAQLLFSRRGQSFSRPAPRAPHATKAKR